jgi:hypothetical protein
LDGYIQSIRIAIPGRLEGGFLGGKFLNDFSWRDPSRLRNVQRAISLIANALCEKTAARQQADENKTRAVAERQATHPGLRKV